MKESSINWRRKLHEVIYEADTREGKLFDVALLIAILSSVLLVMLESVDVIELKYRKILNLGEWIFTALFTIEYILRIISINKPFKYIFSFYGIIDFFSTIPKYLSIFFTGTHSLLALRALRLLRIFRILKLTQFIGESNKFIRALNVGKTKIAVFLFFVLILCIILGTIMYLIEGSDNGFTSIPRSVYWAIVTLTTVGYGDIAPNTSFGQFLASIIMILGYAIIAIPTGIISSEMTKAQDLQLNTQSCPNCSYDKHSDRAEYCNRCGAKLNEL